MLYMSIRYFIFLLIFVCLNFSEESLADIAKEVNQTQYQKPEPIIAVSNEGNSQAGFSINPVVQQTKEYYDQLKAKHPQLFLPIDDKHKNESVDNPLLTDLKKSFNYSVVPRAMLFNSGGAATLMGTQAFGRTVTHTMKAGQVNNNLKTNSRNMKVLKATKTVRTMVPQYLADNAAPYSITKGISKIGKNFGKNALNYGLMVTGIGASACVIDEYVKTGKVNFDKAFDFLQDNSFLRSAGGIFLGSSLMSIASNFLPPGVGPIIKTVPGFIGAAVGHEWSQGKMAEIDWPKMIIGNLASAAAFVALGSGGIVAIAGGIVTSLVADKIYDNVKERLFGKSLPSEEAKYLTMPKYEEWHQKESFEAPAEENLQPRFSNEQPNNAEEALDNRELLRQIQQSAEQNNIKGGQELLRKLQ
jgi:uncharacterized membrane protein YeaQ/YmgE (transglycosylase-associated protein family)